MNKYHLSAHSLMKFYTGKTIPTLNSDKITLVFFTKEMEDLFQLESDRKKLSDKTIYLFAVNFYEKYLYEK